MKGFPLHTMTGMSLTLGAKEGKGLQWCSQWVRTLLSARHVCIGKTGYKILDYLFFENGCNYYF